MKERWADQQGILHNDFLLAIDPAKAEATLSAVQEIGSMLVAGDDLHNVLHLTTRKAVELVDAEVAVIVLMHRGDSPTQIIAHGLQADKVRFAGDSADKGLLGWVVRNRSVALANDILPGERVGYGLDVVLEARSAVAVPLEIREEIIGCFAAFNGRSGDGFDHRDLRTLTLLTQPTTLAVENTRLSSLTNELSLVAGEAEILRRLNGQTDLVLSQASEEIRRSAAFLTSCARLLRDRRFPPGRVRDLAAEMYVEASSVSRLIDFFVDSAQPERLIHSSDRKMLSTPVNTYQILTAS